MQEYLIKDKMRIPKENQKSFTEAFENFKRIQKKIEPFLPVRSESLNSYDEDWDLFQGINKE